jgi:ABC-type multidrug transport system fused ATPase/permease subunit
MDKSTSGVFSQRLLNDTANVIDGIDQLLASVTEAFRLISLLIAYAAVSTTMLIFELVLFVVYLLIQRGHSKSLQEYGRRSRAANERHSGFVTEMTRAHRDIKLLHCEDSFMEKISGSVRESVDLTSQMRYKSMNFILLRSQFVSWTSFAYMALLALMMVNTGMPPSTALVLYNYNGKVYLSARDLGALISSAYDLSLATERIYNLMNSPDYEWEKFGPDHISPVRGELEMRDVFFSFKQLDGKEKKVLKGVNLHIRAGESVALIGRSGCGKTTILSLFSRLYDPDEGTVLLDGVPVQQLDQDTIRGCISMVSQMPYLFNMSIRDNLAVVRKDLTEEEMEEACRLACIHDDIMAFPDGYDTIVGEGGVQISGGQRQRLALARSLLQDSPVIMLDEATSALDNVTQSKISQAIENLRGGRTVIMIAHRLSTVINCERLFFISDGRVLASGTHQELMENCAEYRQLYGDESRAG